MLALAAVDARLAAAIAEAQALDDMLAAWALDVVPGDFDAEAIVARAPIVASAPIVPRAVRRWFAGGALAAAAVAGVMLLVPAKLPPVVSVNSPVQLATAEGDGLGSDAESFASVFTPTVDEDEAI